MCVEATANRWNQTNVWTHNPMECRKNRVWNILFILRARLCGVSSAECSHFAKLWQVELVFQWQTAAVRQMVHNMECGRECTSSNVDKFFYFSQFRRGVHLLPALIVLCAISTDVNESVKWCRCWRRCSIVSLCLPFTPVGHQQFKFAKHAVCIASRARDVMLCVRRDSLSNVPNCAPDQSSHIGFWSFGACHRDDDLMISCNKFREIANLFVGDVGIGCVRKSMKPDITHTSSTDYVDCAPSI